MTSILKKDLRAYFTSSMAYITISILVFLSGVLFFIRLLAFEDFSTYAAMNPMQAGQFTINNFILVPSISNVAFLMLLILPLFTMRSFAEEKRHGTLELLFTYPITEWQLIFGKLLSCLAVVLPALMITALFPLTLGKAPGLDWNYMLTGYLGLLLMAATSVSIGLWVSSMTDKQLVAGIITFVILLGLWMIGWPADFMSGLWKNIFSTLSFDTHFQNFTKGILDLKSILYFLSMSFFFLYLTNYNLIARKWRG